METRPFKDVCDADKVQRSGRLFSCFGGKKTPQWKGLIQVAANTGISPRGLRKGKKSKCLDCARSRFMLKISSL